MRASAEAPWIENRVRILCIHHNGLPPSFDSARDRFRDTEIECDILRPIWVRRREDVEQLFGPGSYPVHTIGRLRYHWFLAMGPKGLRGKMPALWFYLSRGLRLYR